MKQKKPDRSVSEMAILKDIRGLLSVPQERAGSTEAQLRSEASLNAETARLQEQIRYYAELVQKQQEEINRLENENKEFAAKLNMLSSGKDKPMSQESGAEELREEIVQLEARKAELSSVLSQADDLLRLKAQELLKRIARLYQEVGQADIAVEFRKVADDLEVIENSANFLRVLLKQ